jgi:hypothetical protein
LVVTGLLAGDSGTLWTNDERVDMKRTGVAIKAALALVVVRREGIRMPRISRYSIDRTEID